MAKDFDFDRPLIWEVKQRVSREVLCRVCGRLLLRRTTFHRAVGVPDEQGRVMDAVEALNYVRKRAAQWRPDDICTGGRHK